MEYEFDPKLEPPDSPISQDRLTPEYDLSPGSASYGNSWMTNGDTSNSPQFDESEDYAKESIRRLCLVCGDVASGLHYGVASCEACKAFFKRTIQGSIEYSCPASGCCEITRSRRKACQACRFQKCLQMGMLREGVRPDRVRGGRQKYKKTNDSPYVVIRTTKSMNNTNSNLKRPSNGGDVHIRVKPTIAKVCKTVGFELDQPTMKGSKLVHTLKNIEPEKVYARPDKYTGDDETKFKTIISDLTDRELMAIVGWVKQVPDFKSLRLCDQMSLLRSTWLDIVCLNITYRSLPYDGDIVYADDFKVSEEDSSPFGATLELDYVMRRLIRKLSDVKLTYEEYLLLKALLLFNPDVNLDDARLVQQQRDNILEGLLEHEGFQKDSNLPHRVSDLLLVLPLIVHARYITRDFWLNVAADSGIVLPKLLGEMLEYASK